MSISGLKSLFKKMNEDEKFINELLENTDCCLDPFDLTDKEKMLFKDINKDKLLSFKSKFESRNAKDSSQGDEDWWVESVTD